MSLHDYLSVVRRQRWLILQVAILLPLLAVLYSLHEPARYQASSDVLLSGQVLQSNSGSSSQSSGSSSSTTDIATQVQLASVPAIADRAVRSLGPGFTAQTFLSSCSASASANTNILSLTCASGEALQAVKMTNAYAQSYQVYRRELDTNSLESARREIQARISDLVSAHNTGPLYNTLVAREQQLQTTEALQTSNATIIKTATGATQIAPRPKRNAIVGLLLGIVLGFGLAFLREALDTRVRTAREIGEHLGISLLGRLPEPSKRMRAENKLAMLEAPSSLNAEAFRVLRTNIEFTVLDSSIRSLMITSAIEQEGKSTTIANLAIALARGGQNVILVDLDLRRPYIHKFFDLDDRPGVTQVVLGRASIDEALTEITIAPVKQRRGAPVNYDVASANGQSSANGNGGDHVVAGRLSVLGAGPIPPDPGEFVSSQALSAVLAGLQSRADIVLVDSPPLLRVGDSMVLSAKVDAIVLATRMAKVRRPMLNELHRMLVSSPARVLGFVVTGAEAEEGYGSGYGYGYGYGYGAGSRYYLPRGDEPELTDALDPADAEERAPGRT